MQEIVLKLINNSLSFNKEFITVTLAISTDFKDFS